MAQCNVTDEAFVTLATNDVYCRGALVLAESLKKQGTTRKLVVMIAPHVSEVARKALSAVFDLVTVVNVLDSNDAAHLALLKRPELGITFTKIHCWTLTQFKKCIFMDADMLALMNIDELFEREELSAAPDSGWPDLFNSGLFVFRPSMETFSGLLQLAEKEGSFDGGDQGLLNTYFSSWLTSDISRHLSFLYNLHVTASYTYLPAFKRFGADTKVVHFLGPVKPWHHVYNRISGAVKQVGGSQDQSVQQYPAFLTRWWEIYNDKIRTYFSTEDEIMAEEISTHSKIIVIPAAFIPPENDAQHENQNGGSSTQNGGGPRTPEQIKQDLYSHMRDWEEGRIDYTGRDSFANIQAHIDANIEQDK